MAAGPTVAVCCSAMDQSATILIHRPASVVFAYVMQVAHDAQWRRAVVEAAYSSEGPLGVGTRGFDRISTGARERVAAWTTVEYEPGRLARWKFDSGPVEGSGGYLCEADGQSTRFTLESRIRPTGPLRWLGPLFDWLVRRGNRADVAQLKTILELDEQ